MLNIYIIFYSIIFRTKNQTNNINNVSKKKEKNQCLKKKSHPVQVRIYCSDLNGHHHGVKSNFFFINLHFY